MYQVKSGGFDGPIELLLELVKKSEVDIYEVWIANITSQFLEYLSVVQGLDVDEALEFLVIASSLVYLKSKALLPKEEFALQAEEQEVEISLERQIEEYERYRKIAEQLKDKAIITSQQYPRQVPEDLKKEEYIEANLFDLVAAFKTILAEAAKRDEFAEIKRETVTVEQKMEEILGMLTPETPSIKFSDAFRTATTRIEIIVSFLALLELIRLKKIAAMQKKLFAEIELVRMSVLPEPPAAEPVNQ